MEFEFKQSNGFSCDWDLLKELNDFFNGNADNVFIKSVLLKYTNLMIFCYRNNEEPWIEIRTYIKPIMNIAFHKTDYNRFIEIFSNRTEYDEETRHYVSRIIEFIYSVYDIRISLQQYRHMNIEKALISIDILKDTDYDKIYEEAKSIIKTDSVILEFTADVTPLLGVRLYRNMNNKILMEFTIKTTKAIMFKWDRAKIFNFIRETLNLAVPATSSIVTILNSIYDICSEEVKNLDSLEYTSFGVNAVYGSVKLYGKAEWEICNNARILLKPFGEDYIITGYINGSHMYSDTIPGYLLTNKHVDANYHIYTRVIMALDYIYDQQHMIIGKNNKSIKEIAIDFGICKECYGLSKYYNR